MLIQQRNNTGSLKLQIFLGEDDVLWIGCDSVR